MTTPRAMTLIETLASVVILAIATAAGASAIRAASESAHDQLETAAILRALERWSHERPPTLAPWRWVDADGRTWEIRLRAIEPIPEREEADDDAPPELAIGVCRLELRRDGVPVQNVALPADGELLEAIRRAQEAAP